MDLKTIKQIEKICKLDIDIKATIMFEFTKAYSNVVSKFMDDNLEVEQCIEELEVSGVFNIDSRILEYLGFNDTDDAVTFIIDNYLYSNNEDRMDTLKKELIEMVFEVDDKEIE
ncbi:hypothetical protein [Rossellomorea vietnamensis]|uniref:hypothetical protein n=1 Tax=Rossellomorea vietnamensis TaxID=218284 RepID=UPI003D267949